MGEQQQPVRQGLAAVGGALAMCVALFVALYVAVGAFGVATGTDGGNGYADPSRAVRVLVGLGLAVVGFGGAGLFGWGGLGLYRFGMRGPAAWTWWTPVKLAVGAAAAFGWVVGFLFYEGSLGAFS